MSVFETVFGNSAPICSRIPPIVLTSNSARACSGICWRCRWPISRRVASAIRSRGCANSKTSAIPHQFGADAGDRPVLHLRLSGGDVLLLADADLDRSGLSRSISRISAGATPLFRQRLDEKFKRGAENQAFLVESVTGIETLSRWRSSPRCSAAGKSNSPAMWPRVFASSTSATTPARPCRSSTSSSTAAILYFGAGW